MLRFIATVFVCLFSIAFAQGGEFAPRNPRYKLQVNDVLEVKFRYTPEFNQTVTVQPDGYISIESVGDLKVQDLTLEEAKQSLVKQASERLNQPEISLLLKQYEKPYITVTGQVGRPGRYDLQGETTAVEAVAMAGGLTASSKHSQVLLFHRLTADKGEAKILDLKKTMNNNMNEDVFVQPGDVLIVPQNTVSKIERFVKWGNFGIYANPGLP